MNNLEYLSLGCSEKIITASEKDGVITRLVTASGERQPTVDEMLTGARLYWIRQVQAASKLQRLKYVTDAAGKDAEYSFKAAEAAQFDVDAAVGTFMQARMTATGETAAQVATLWNARSAAWKTVGATIAATVDKAGIDIDAATTVDQCETIAATAVATIEGL